MRTKDQIILESLYNVVLEGLQNVNEIANKFCNDFLSNYERDEKGTFNCAWATQQFILWAKQNGIDAKAIYLVWPDRPDGEAHIAPVVNNQILDFTIHQFDKSVKDCYKITPVNDWKKVYGPFGYGENYVNIDGKNQTVMVNTFEYFNNSTKLGGQEGKAGLTIYPAKLKI
jgi:hypothetical protein